MQDSQLEEQSEEAVQPRSEFLDVCGARVHVLRAGDGRPLLLIHGLTGSTTNWRRNFDALARTASVYAIDLVNMGRSGRVAGLDAGLEATAARVLACMDALGLAQADVAGHSHGGAVAFVLAALYPERVRSLVLFAPANPYSDLGDRLVRLYSTAIGGRIARLGLHLPRRAQLYLLGRMYGDPARIVPGTLEGYVEGLHVQGSIEHVLGIVRAWFTDMKLLRSLLPRVATPALLIWGDRDRAVSLASGRRLHQELAGSELRVVQGGGHVVFEEFPDQANLAMVEWLTRSHTGSSSAPTPFAQGVREPSRSAIPAVRAQLSPALHQAASSR